jgi:hypothetical protein
MEVGEIHGSHKADNLLGLCLALCGKAMEVHLGICRYRVVNNYIKFLKRNSACCNICEHKRCDLAFLKLLNSFAELNLWHVADQL